MKILSGSIHQFRNLADKQFAFSDRFTLISGSHGSGKSSLLDAVSLLLAELPAAMGISAVTEREAAMLIAKGELQGIPLDWGYRRSEKATVQHGGGMFARAEQMMAARDSVPENPFPVFAYYSRGGDRSPRPDGGEFGSQYIRCLDPADPIPDAVQWGSDDQCVRQAIATVAPVDPDAGIPSGGIGRLASLVRDLASRCLSLNPALRDQAVLETAGVVLIEELEAGLHPSRQRRLIEDLRKAFPRVQFMATTYSPFIIQSLDGGILIDLDSNEPHPYPDLSIEDITETVLGIPLPQRSKRYLDMNAAAAEYLAVLHNAGGAGAGEKQRLKERLDELMMPYSNQQAFCAVLEAERLDSGIDDEDVE